MSFVHEVSWPDRKRGPFCVVVKLEEVFGRIECVGLEVGTQDPKRGTVTAVRVRSLPVGRIVADAVRELQKQLDHTSGGAGAPLLNESSMDAEFLARRAEFWADAQAAAEALRPVVEATSGTPTRGRRWPAGTHEQVATIYNAAAALGQPPTAAVARELGVSDRTASHLVATARAKGLLPPTTRGRPTRGSN